MPIKPIDLEQFVQKAKNVHEAIVAASRRARQINEQMKIEFNQRIELFVPKQETEGEENDVNPDQLKVSLEFEKRPKPTDVALDELMQGRLEWKYKEKELPVFAEEEASDEAADDEE
jgi:DNA-directed RNA polymerase subunit K/omega